MKISNNVCEEETFSQIYNDYGKTIWNFLYFKCGDNAQADDLVQDAFIKLWQNCKKVSREKAKSFLYTVSNNMFLNQVAHRKVVLQYAQLQPYKMDTQSPQYLLEEKQYHQRLQNAIANLTDAQRTAFLLNRIEGKKYAEIAKILDISVKAVEKRMSKTLTTLRKTVKL